MKPLVKKNTRFNFLDVFLILCIVLAVIGLLFYVLPRQKTGKTVLCTLSVSGLRADFADRLREGDLVYDESGAVQLGTLEKAEVEADTLTVTDQAGHTLSASYPPDTLCRATLFIRTAPAAETEGGYTVEGSPILLNNALTVRTARVSCTGICTALFAGGEEE